jgi:hypothetical protein
MKGSKCREQIDKRGIPMRTVLPLLFLALVPLASAQTTTTVNPGSCRAISNCRLSTSDGNVLWVSNPNFVDILASDGTILRSCTGIVTYQFGYTQSPPPSSSNLSQVPFTLHVECDFSGGSITVDQQGFGYYWRGGGGKGGGGAGVVYRVSSGTVTMN